MTFVLGTWVLFPILEGVNIFMSLPERLFEVVDQVILTFQLGLGLLEAGRARRCLKLGPHQVVLCLE